MSPPTSAPHLPPAGAASADHAKWFTAEVHVHDGQLKAYLRGSFPAVRDVDDVVQESYLRFWKARAAKPIQSAKAFLFQVARNLALDVIRKHRRSPLDEGRESVASRVLDSSPDAAEKLIASDTLDHLADAIAALPERCREAVVLHKLHGIPQRELAGRLGVSERTIEKHCRVGLRRCEAHLAARGIHGFFR